MLCKKIKVLYKYDAKVDRKVQNLILKNIATISSFQNHTKIQELPGSRNGTIIEF